MSAVSAAHPAQRARALLTRCAARRHRLVGLAALRVVLGLAALEFYVTEYGNRRLLWGPEGYVPLDTFRETVPLWGTSLYGWGGSAAYFETVHHLGILAAVAFCVCGGRALTLVHGLFVWSVQLRGGHALDHGHVLARFLLLFLLFATCDAYLSPWARRRRARLRARAGQVSWRTAAHNCAVFLMVFQICVVYFMGGVWKLLGPRWRDGTAFYYVVHSLDSPPAALMTGLASVAWVTVLVTYATVGLEVAFPVLAASGHRFAREAAALGAALMHLGIVPLVGLLNFSLVMIAADCLVPRDSDYRATGLALRRFGRGGARAAPGSGARLGAWAAAGPFRHAPSGTMEPCPDARPPAVPPRARLAVPRSRSRPAPAASPPSSPSAAGASTPERPPLPRRRS